MKQIAPFLFLLLWVLDVDAKERAEYTLKGAFVERFTRFISWPDAMASSDTVYLGIVGKGESFKELKTFFDNVKIQEKPVEVLNVVSLSSLERFHILFIEDETQFDITTVRSRLGEAGTTLTIGDEAHMASSGLMISFFLEESKLKFKVNTGEIEQAGFRVSSFLLKMAVIVKTGSEDE